MSSNDPNDHRGSCEDGVCRPFSKKSGTTKKDGSVEEDQRQNGTDNDRVGDLSKEGEEFTIKIEIISDTMCPWCWVGKRNLEAALRNYNDEAMAIATDKAPPESQPFKIKADITWVPYFLDKHLPENGKKVKDYYRDNYGDAMAGERMKPGLVKAGRRCGIDFESHFVDLTHYRPTIRSHRLIHYIQERHPHLQDAIVEALFDMYYQKGRHLNSIDHLYQVAKTVLQLNDNEDDDDKESVETIRRYLESDEDEADVFEAARFYQPMAQGVPTFVFTKPDAKNLYHKFSGGQPPSAFERVFAMFQSAYSRQRTS